MKTAVINFKVDPKLKAQAQKRAKKLGVPLSFIMNQQLQNFATGRLNTFEFPTEKMTPHLEKLIAKVERENEELGTIGPFATIEEAMDYLNNLPDDED